MFAWLRRKSLSLLEAFASERERERERGTLQKTRSIAAFTKTQL